MIVSFVEKTKLTGLQAIEQRRNDSNSFLEEQYCMQE
jgi:hypothetical protein